MIVLIFSLKSQIYLFIAYNFIKFAKNHKNDAESNNKRNAKSKYNEV